MNPLLIEKEALGAGSPIAVEIVSDNDAVIERFASDILTDYLAAKAAGRERVVLIVPVGPVGQFDIVAKWCNREGISLRDLVVVNMDEYLTPDGRAFISTEDPLSFRRHMDDHFYNLLDPRLAPAPDHRIFPDPADVDAVPRAIEAFGGVDVCYGGVGITGHIAFNDPPEPDHPVSLDAFRDLPTRIVRLSRETLLINSITTSRGNVDRIPKLAVTVGMKEILASRKVRIYMNREWQSAQLRKVLHGPVTPAVPASLLQEHADVQFVAADYVAELPEPILR